MLRSFRVVPPEPRADALARPRLLRALVGRWQRPVTSVVGGAGLGKTTLLAQALAENRMAPRGDDLWVGVEPDDGDADRFARVVEAAVSGRDADEPDSAERDAPLPAPGLVADMIWQRTPVEACLVLDDVHRLPSGSTGAAWLNDLVAALPANGHVVVSGRSEPPLPMERLEKEGQVLRLDETELRFDEAELSGFAEQRGLDSARFGDTGGWPAMIELVAAVEGRGTASTWESYLWEEVLDPLGRERRRVLAVLCDLGGADDALASAALQADVELDQALDRVPLVACDDDGWHAPHALWRGAPGIELPAAERRQVRRRAARHHADRGRFDEAFRLLQEVELWDDVPDVLRAACLTENRLVPSRLGRWLASSPDHVRDSSAGCLASCLHLAFTEPDHAIEPLQQAVERFHDEGDVDAEITAVAQLGLLAGWQQDIPVLALVAARVAELEGSGHRRARALAAFCRAVVADVEGNDDQVLRELDTIEPQALDPWWEVLAAFLRTMLHLDRDEPDVVIAEIGRLRTTASPAIRYVLDLLELRAWWTSGRLDDAMEGIPPALAAARRTGVPYNVYLGAAYGCIGYAQLGRVAEARRWLDESLAAAPPPPAGDMTVFSAMATAALQLAEGDEPRATATLRQAMEAYGLDQGLDRRGWRHALPLSYVLLPETRSYWDGVPLRGYLAVSRTLAATVARAREAPRSGQWRALDLPPMGLVHSTLHVRFAAELALGLSEVGRPEGHEILDRFGPPGRTALRDLTSTQPRRARAARSLLAAVAAPPNRSSYLAVLGPLVLRRDGSDGEEVAEPSLRRRRLQALVGFLVAHRRTTRSAIAAALWPDLDARAASNNLAVTLNHLLRVLEPWRDSREPSYLVRLEGPQVSLRTGEHLGVDVDDFTSHLAAASRAETEGNPAEALDHHLAAVEVYRDDLHVELPEADWFALEREHYRTRFVTAATRAGQLLVSHGDVERAQNVARRALVVDPWSEEAYGVLISGALARGDRSAARRLLMRCLAMLNDLGAQPSPAIQQLHRRIQGIPA